MTLQEYLRRELPENYHENGTPKFLQVTDPTETIEEYWSKQ